MLERELANLDQLLASVADWKALCVVEAQKKFLAPGADTSGLDMESRKLRARLAENRIFNARERIVEAIALIRHELGRDPLGAPVVAKTMEDQANYDEPAPAVKPAQPETTPAPIKEIAAHSQIAPSQADTISPSSPPCMMSQVASQMAKTEHRYRPAVLETSSKDEILAPGAARVREQTKVTIHKMPPDSEGVDKNLARGSTDDLSKIRGISFETAQKLNALGVRSYRQIAAWTAKDVASVRIALGVGRRIARENWIDQAAHLAANSVEEAQVDISHISHIQEKSDSQKKSAASSSVPAAQSETDSIKSHSADKNALVARAAATIVARFDPDGTRNTTAQPQPTQKHAKSSMSTQKGGHDGAQSKQTNTVAAAVATILASLGSGQSNSKVTQHPSDSRHVTPPREEAPSRQIDERIGHPQDVENQVLETKSRSELTKKKASSEPSTDHEKSPPKGEPADKLQEIRFIDDALARALANAGVTRFSQISNWSAADIEHFRTKLNLGHRITREAWIEQAEILAIGGTTAYVRTREQEGDTQVHRPHQRPEDDPGNQRGGKAQSAKGGATASVEKEGEPPPLPISGPNSAFEEDSPRATTLADRLQRSDHLESAKPQEKPQEEAGRKGEETRKASVIETRDDKSDPLTDTLTGKPDAALKTPTGPQRHKKDLSTGSDHLAQEGEAEEPFNEADFDKTNFDDAEVEIVPIKHEAPQRPGEHSALSKKTADPDKTTSRSLSQRTSRRDGAFDVDADNDTAYSGQIPEASVSIISKGKPSRTDRPGASHERTKPLIRK